MAAVIPPHLRTGNMASDAQLSQGTCCGPCGSRLVELKRQAMKLMMVEYHKSLMFNTGLPALGPLLLAVYQQIRLPERYLSGLDREQCEICGAHVEILKREAVLALHSVSVAPQLAQPQVQHSGIPVSHSRNSNSAHTCNNNMMVGNSDIQGMSISSSEVISTRKAIPNENIPQSAQTAAVFFAKAAQKFNIPAKKKIKKSSAAYKSQYDDEEEKQLFPTNFSKVLQSSTPLNPPGLFRYVGRRVDGKVKVMLRVASCKDSENTSMCLKVDQRRKQVTLTEPRDSAAGVQKLPGMAPSAPKMFAFDAIFESSATKTEVCSAALLDVLHAVINGGDGCLLVYGGPGLGKTDSMVGKDQDTQTAGAIPNAIAWLYSLIEDSKQRTGARFSVRVSAVEIVGRSENLKDLLSEQVSGGDSASSAGTSPGIWLREDPIGGVQLSNVSELRAATADKAAFYLDAALASRTTVPVNSLESIDVTEYQGSHMIFTLHIYQYRIDKSGRGGVQGGRSRLHLIDLSAWQRNAFSNGLAHSAPSQAALGSIIIAMLNKLKHAHRDSKLTRLLKDSIGNMSCRTTVLCHVSPDEERYSETLGTLQMISKISRSRRKKNKYCSASSSGGESSCDEGRLGRRKPKPAAVLTCGIEDAPRNEISDYTSSAAEDSCDTVIYVGPNGAISDKDLTDNEGPPTFDNFDEDDSFELNTNDKRFKLSESAEKRMSPKFAQKMDSVESVNIGSISSSQQAVPAIATKDTEDVSDGESTPRLEPELPPLEIDQISDGRSSPRFGPRMVPLGHDVKISPDLVSTRSEATNEEKSKISQGQSSPRLELSLDSKENAVVVQTESIQNECLLYNDPIVNQFCDNMDEDDDKCLDEDFDEEDRYSCIGENILAAIKGGSKDRPTVSNEPKEAVEESITNDVEAGNCCDEVKAPLPQVAHLKDLSSTGYGQGHIPTELPEHSGRDYFAADSDEEEYSYLHMGPITEKELRKSEKRIKKLLKGEIDLEAVVTGQVRERSKTFNNYSSECETENTRTLNSNGKESGYSSAPETEVRQRKLQKLANRFNEHKQADANDVDMHVAETTKTSLEASEKRHSAESTKEILKAYVTKKLQEERNSPVKSRELSPQSPTKLTSSQSSAKTSEQVLINSNQKYVPSSPNKVKYVSANKANIKSTKLYRGSMSSLNSSDCHSSTPSPALSPRGLNEGFDRNSSLNHSFDRNSGLNRSYERSPGLNNSFERAPLNNSYDKADSVSLTSCADSEERHEVASLDGRCQNGPRRVRTPIKIHYRWSTVYEEDEKSKDKETSNDRKSNSKNKNDKDGTGKDKHSKDKKTSKKSDVKTKDKENDKDKAYLKGRKEGGAPKSKEKSREGLKLDLTIDDDCKISRHKKSKKQAISNSKVSVNSDLSGIGSNDSGIASNDTSSMSQQSTQGSSVALEGAEIEYSVQSPISPRHKKWFFNRDRHSKSRSRHHSGYVSDGNITDSSQTSSRSRRSLFGRKSRLSSSGGHSSGYESMRTDGGISNLSGAESGSETPTKRKRKRFLGFRRRSTSDLSRKGRSKRSYWIDNPGVYSDEEQVEYKVYQIEDIDSPRSPRTSKTLPQGSSLRNHPTLLDSHRKRVMELKNRRDDLETEVESAMDQLMLDKEKLKVKGAEEHDPDDPQYANELEREVGLFQRRLRVLKAHLQVITCFDKFKKQRTSNKSNNN